MPFKQLHPSIPLTQGSILFFMSHFERVESGCWEWTGQLNSRGYGCYSFTYGRKRKLRLAHRIAWTLSFGPIEPGKVVCHKCDNPKCVYLKHLFLGTQGDNLFDMYKKGRHPQTDRAGEKNGRAFLTENLVRKIRTDYDNGVTVSSMSSSLGIKRSTLYDIIGRRSWEHVT